MRRGLGAAVLVLALFGVLVATAGANHSWNGYHWARTANPFTLQVGDNVSSQWDAYLNDAIGDWNPSSKLDLVKVTGASKGNCRPTSGRIEVCNKAYGNNGWLGLAQIWVTGGTHITQGVAKMNDTYFNSPPYNTGPWRELVMCQEIAHDFGLDHQDENFNNTNLGSCMDYTSNPSGPPSNTDPNSHDFQQLDSIYAHTDSFNTYGQSSAGFLPDAVPSFAPAHRVSKSTYVDDLGGGRKLVTHVFWVP
jgi:hypothetical protein